MRLYASPHDFTLGVRKRHAPALAAARCRACSWGAISNSSFGPNEAVVACRTLLFPDPPRAAVAASSSYEPLLIQQLSCTGQESSLRDCNITWCNEGCPGRAYGAAVRCA